MSFPNARESRKLIATLEFSPDECSSDGLDSKRCLSAVSGTVQRVRQALERVANPLERVGEAQSVKRIRPSCFNLEKHGELVSNTF